MHETGQLKSINKQARDQLSGLSLMFLLGMGVNLIGLPSETSGGAKTTTSILLGLHIIMGLGLLAGGIFVVTKARSSLFSRQAWTGLALLTLTVTCGVATAITKNNWWSYGMSVGFIMNVWVFGNLYVRTRGGQ
jgi:hypothetical protein